MKEFRITEAELQTLANYIGRKALPWVETNPLMNILTAAGRRPLKPTVEAVVEAPKKQESDAAPSGEQAPDPVQ